MKKVLLWFIFFILLILIVSPVDIIPDALPAGFLDDILYGVLAIIAVALLHGLAGKKKALPAAKAGNDDTRKPT